MSVTYEEKSVTRLWCGVASKGGQSPEWARKVPEKSRTRSRFALTAWLLLAPGSATASDPEIHYAPNENLERIDVATISQATRSIDMAAYVLTDWPVIEALTAAARRGVVVRIYVDGEQAGRADMNERHPFARLMTAPGVTIKNKAASAALMHLKSYCIDGRLLRSGSANFSASGLKDQDNDLILFEGGGFCAGFTAAFSRAWASPDAE